jgi:exodeoxyribonuclease VII small subunit
MAKAKDKSKEESFEQLFSELESTVAKLEGGDLLLDESLVLFQRGMELAKKCGRLLDQAELRLKELVPHGDVIEVEDSEEE